MWGKSMAGRECPKCGQLKLYVNRTRNKWKGECKNCGFKMKLPFVMITRDGSLDMIIEKIIHK